MKYPGITAMLLLVTFFVSFLKTFFCNPGQTIDNVVPKNNLEMVVVEYEIQYGSIYTGDQTPIVCKGVDTLEVNPGMGITDIGLPIVGFFPTHSSINFCPEDRKKLHISADINPTGIVLSGGTNNFVLMKVDVYKDKNKRIFVRDIPA